MCNELNSKKLTAKFLKLRTFGNSLNVNEYQTGEINYNTGEPYKTAIFIG